MVVSILISVLLPAPFEPIRPKISAASTRSGAASKAFKSPKRRMRSVTSITGWPVPRVTALGLGEIRCTTQVLRRKHPYQSAPVVEMSSV